MIIEALVIVLGLCICCIPFIMFFSYLLVHVNKKTSFDYHLALVKDKKGCFGVVIAYLEKVMFSISLISLGVMFGSFFANEISLKVFVFSVVIYVIIKYIDEKNEN